MMKLALFLMMLYALPQTDCWRSQKSFVLNSPGKVWAARGSCLVIPGSFDYPKRFSHDTVQRCSWKKETEEVIAVFSTAVHPVHRDFQGRSRYLGYTKGRVRFNATWELRGVRSSDAGNYFFRLTLPQYSVPRVRWSWRYQPTVVQVVDAKRPVMSLKVGGGCGEVVAFCSVAHTCPSHPPILSWSCSGGVQSGSSPTPGGWLWVSYSTLTFTKAENITLRMYCSARHDGGRRLDSNVISV